MAIRVTSEVGRLRRVLVHEPGPEVDRMVPAMMEDLLFDDILFGDRAREEHRRFKRLLQLFGIEVLDAGSLLAETLAGEDARRWLFDVLLEDLPLALRRHLATLSPAGLARALVAGLRRDEAPGFPGAGDELFAILPLPNLCFQRDPQVVLGEGVVFAAMAAPARWREALLARAIFRHHPAFRDVPVLCDPLRPEGDRALFLGLHRPRLEGGDLLVLSPDVVAVGRSERTNARAIQCLARSLVGREDGPRWLLVVELPRGRAFMHLDTVITPVDRDACLVYPPLFLGEGPLRAAAWEIDLRGEDLEPRPTEGLLAALRARGLDLEPIPCGGEDSLLQQREQWTDGANAFALAPGVITLYERNAATAETLARRGFHVVGVEDVLLGRHELDLDAPRRTCILLSSHEISRARGGPHCLTHPLARDP